MATVFEVLAFLNFVGLSFLLGETVLLIIFDTRGGWKLRSGKVEGHPNLKPFTKTWKIVFVFILIVILVLPVIDFFMAKWALSFLEQFGWYLVPSLIIVLSLLYLWTAKLIVGTKLRGSDLIPVLIILLTVGITILLRYYGIF